MEKEFKQSRRAENGTIHFFINDTLVPEMVCGIYTGLIHLLKHQIFHVYIYIFLVFA